MTMAVSGGEPTGGGTRGAAPRTQSGHAWTPDAASGITTRFVEANGIRFDLAECGRFDREQGAGAGGDASNPDGTIDAAPRLALLLHGFPELNYSWRAQMPLFAARGYRVWAPNMRGYGGSSRPAGVAAYRLDTLVADVAEIGRAHV